MFVQVSQIMKNGSKSSRGSSAISLSLMRFWKMSLKQHSKVSPGAARVMRRTDSPQETLHPTQGEQNRGSRPVHRRWEIPGAGHGHGAEVPGAQ